MKKTGFFIILLLLSGKALAEKKRPMVPFHILSDSVNPNLTKHEAEFKFMIWNSEFQDPPFQIILRTSVNGVWKEVAPDSAGCFSYKVEPGEYQFQFYANENFREISSEKVTIRSRHEITVRLSFMENFYNWRNNIQVDKPIIYLHTDQKREFEIGVQPKDEFSFVYPEMSGIWKGIAEENGTITIAGKNYPYLFWEGTQQYVFASEENGYKVDKKEVIPFLSEKLTELGLDQQEQTDFITYWGPKLAANETSFVQFSVDESCNAFATMSCFPVPDAIRRVYIQVAPWDPGFEPYLKDVVFKPVSKSSWYVLEWGGFTFNTNDL